MRIASVCLLGLIALALPVSAQEQRVAEPVEIRTLFQGEAERLGKRVLLQQIRIEGGQEAARLDLPDGGLLILQLQAGELATIIDGDRQTRAEGEWWMVEKPSSMVLQTEDDSAVVDTILVLD